MVPLLSSNQVRQLTTELSHYRSIFISDCHLGLKGTRSDALLQFLETNNAETIYLVGDIIDQWCKGRKWHWPIENDLILQKIVERSTCGSKIVYIPGNHDDSFRKWSECTIQGVEIKRETVHITADGRKLWVIHGDEFDLFMRHKWLCNLGHFSVQILMKLNKPMERIRKVLGFKPWSLATAARRSLQRNSKTYKNYVDSVTKEALYRGYDGVVCGHIHNAEFRLENGVEYWNDGDWLESCTAICESMDGSMEIVHYEYSKTFLSLRNRSEILNPKIVSNRDLIISSLKSGEISSQHIEVKL